MKTGQYNHSAHLVAIDCIILGYENTELKLLLFNRKIEPAKGGWSLVGGWVEPDESVETAARRVTYKISGLKEVYLEQVHVFSEPQRDPGGRVISVAFYALMPIDKHDRELVESHGAKWFSLNELPELIFDHQEMLNMALEKLRLKASFELIGRSLLPEKFTLLQIRQLYNAIYQKEFDPGNFRKKILSIKVLEKLTSKNTSESRKGAFNYRFKKVLPPYRVNALVKY
ncbi:MAG: NUDIX hydrolase [Bacteroidales bacterium]|nr:NUDIX hydrolase [Bacteroidales bacterium]